MADDLRWWSALDTAAAIRSGPVSAAEVLEASIARIEILDAALGAVVIPLFDRARSVTTEGTSHAGGLFHGVPMLLKDAGEELAGTSHWVGTQGLSRSRHRSAMTTELADRLESLGFVMLGKSSCPELSASSTTEPVGFAPARNPWALDRTAGGSSGGSAAAVAVGLVPIAHGSDATGSLRFPASHCGAVTLKPSRGRIPISPPMGQIDPLRAPFSFTGQPALVVPITTTTAGLPVGVQVVGRHGDDERLLALGAKLQTVFGWLDRYPPNPSSAPRPRSPTPQPTLLATTNSFPNPLDFRRYLG